MTSQPRNRSKPSISRNSHPPGAERKRRDRGNKRNHDFAPLERHYVAASADLEALARAMCGENQDPALLAQARIVVESHLIRQAERRVRFERIEQCLAKEPISEDEYLNQRAERLIAAIFARFENHLPPLARMRETYALEQFVKDFTDKQPATRLERDENEALELTAAVDELECNESQAWSRQMQAIRAFVELNRNS